MLARCCGVRRDDAMRFHGGCFLLGASPKGVGKGHELGSTVWNASTSRYWSHAEKHLNRAKGLGRSTPLPDSDMWLCHPEGLPGVTGHVIARTLPVNKRFGPYTGGPSYEGNDDCRA